jgi:hypothetical protein
VPDAHQSEIMRKRSVLKTERISFSAHTDKRRKLFKVPVINGSFCSTVKICRYKRRKSLLKIDL